MIGFVDGENFCGCVRERNQAGTRSGGRKIEDVHMQKTLSVEGSLRGCTERGGLGYSVQQCVREYAERKEKDVIKMRNQNACEECNKTLM